MGRDKLWTNRLDLRFIWAALKRHCGDLRPIFHVSSHHIMMKRIINSCKASKLVGCRLPDHWVGSKLTRTRRQSLTRMNVEKITSLNSISVFRNNIFALCARNDTLSAFKWKLWLTWIKWKWKVNGWKLFTLHEVFRPVAMETKNKYNMCELVTTFYECLSIRNLVQFARCQLPHIVDERSTMAFFKWNMKTEIFH